MAGVLVVNPYASRVTEPLVEAVARELGVADVLRTEHPGHATELVETLTAADAIYVFSGDGGFNEALNGSDGLVPLGLLPGGGTSVLPRALGVPRDPLAAARALAQGRPRRIGLGRVNGRRFGFSAGIGLDAELIRRMDARGRDESGRRPGDLVFAWTAARTLWETRARLEPALEVEGHGRAAFALVANGDPYTYAGRIPLHVAPLARFEAGLDLVAPRRLRPASLPHFLGYLARGRGQERAADVLYLRDVDRLQIACERPLPLQVDGEDLGDVSAARIEAERDAVTVLVP